MEIKGTTRLVGLFGDPVEHTFSPAMHNAAFEELGLDYVYLPFEVHPGDLEAAVGSLIPLGIRGVNVTVPHKEKVIPFLDEIAREARLIGSVNTIAVRDRRLKGHNTDAYGFETSLRNDMGFDLRSKKIFVMGAGGVSRAICFQSALSGARELVIADLRADAAEALCRAVAAAFPECRMETCPADDAGEIRRVLEGKDLFVNATPVGMGPEDPNLIDVGWLPAGAYVFDVIYNPAETRLLREARETGHRTLNGIGMLVYQGARAFEIFTGEKPPVDIMMKALEEKL